MLKLDEMNIEVFNHLSYKDYMVMCNANRSINQLCKESTILKSKLRKSIKHANRVMTILKSKIYVVLQPITDDFIFDSNDYLFKSPFVVEMIYIHAHHFKANHVDITFEMIDDQGNTRNDSKHVKKEELYQFLIALFFDQVILTF